MYLHAYLPDELGRRAKEAGLPVSQLLRDAVERELSVQESTVRIEHGIQRAGSDLLIQINAAHRARRNGVTLVPAELLPEPPRRVLRVSVDALGRWLSALED